MIHLGACEDILPTLASESFDGILMDPPYGLGSNEPTAAQLDAYLAGSKLKTGDFMGADWDIPSVPIWREIFRVLKTGNLLFSFAGTRTLDIIGLGIQEAGFRKQGSLLWVHGQGWPKAGDLGKAIDKAKGLEREVIGVNPHQSHKGPPGSLMFKGTTFAGGAVTEQKDVPLTAPASEEAKKWDGWSTQLKPAWEPIMVYSKGEPLEPLDFSEPFIYCGKAKKSETSLNGRLVNSHPTKKPLLLMQKLVQRMGKKGGLILDPYMGSGTTAVACLLEGCSSVGIELNPVFHALATERVCLVGEDEEAARPFDLDALFNSFDD